MDLMIDLETLSTSNNAAIVTMAAIKFDPHADYSKITVDQLPPNQVYYKRIDLDSCLKIGLITNEQTIEWWGTQPKEAQDEAFGEGNGLVDVLEMIVGGWQRLIMNSGDGVTSANSERGTEYRRAGYAAEWEHHRQTV